MVAMIQYQRNLSDTLLGKELIKSYLEDIPNYPGIYRMLDIDKRVIYIGKAKNLKNRLKQYIGDIEGKTSIMISLTHYLEYSVTESESSALLLEGQLIKKFKPKFNILLKDDKSFPYIKLRLDHEFPQLLKYRGRELKDGKFFGPFASVKHVEVTLLELQKIFKLRSCSDSYFASRKRPCLQYQINRCSAPCTGKISKENYDELVDQIKTFLSGKNLSLQDKLAKKMQLLSDRLEFEEAAKIRDRIKALSYIQLKAEGTGLSEDTDLIAITMINGEYCIQLCIYRAGQACGNHPYFPECTEDKDIPEILEAFIMQLYQDKIPPKHIILSHPISDDKIFSRALKELHDVNVKIMISKKSGTVAGLVQIALENAKIALEQHIKNSAKNIEALEAVQKIFNLPSLPNRIEVYDNSHIQGSFAIGAMIVAGRDGFQKKEYRLFTIKEQPENALGGDDYSMLREVLTRKLTKLETEPHRMPDLMIIDGGKGHMKIVEQVLRQFDLNIPFVCMSKGIDRNSGREQFHRPDYEVFTLDKNLPAMKYLQILRDEAHNFAIKNHRKKRSTAIKISSLDSIPGIGEIRKKSLLSYFGSFSSISDATIEDIMKVDGINKELATIIYEAIRK
jgi:excinuclease ABC subunit C